MLIRWSFMNNKTYLKKHRKKSVASFILAFLLMFTFNSSPIIMIANNGKNANAYQSSETKTFYTSSKNENETKFSDPSYPSSYKDAFSDETGKFNATNNKNFNLLSYYNAKFEEYCLDLAHKFFLRADEVSSSETNYADQYSEFLAAFGANDLYDFFIDQKNSFLKTEYKITTAVQLLEQMGIRGFKDYLVTNGDEPERKSLPAITGVDGSISGTILTAGKYVQLSDFYRLMANITLENNGTGNVNAYPADSEEYRQKLAAMESDEAFYKKASYEDKKEGNTVGNTHYNRFVDGVDAMILETAPTYAFDNETQDTNVAAIFANLVPTTVSYNYGSTNTSYNVPKVTYSTASKTDLTKKIYYFGDKTALLAELRKSGDEEDANYKLADAIEPYISEVNPSDKTLSNVFLYRLIQPEDQWGYISDKYPTYYQYEGYTNTNTTPYNTYAVDKTVSSTGYVKEVYVLTSPNTTQSEIDTYASLYYKTLSPKEYENNKDYFVQVPYEDDEMYFRVLFNELHSTKGLYGIDSAEKFSNFINYFTDNGVSKLYVRLSHSTYNYVYIEESQYDDFVKKNSDYPFEVKPLATSWKKADYVKITENTGSGSLSYYRKDYDLYFERTKEFYTEADTPTYEENSYEITYSPIIPYEKHNIASSNYAMENNERKLFVLSDSTETTINVPSIEDATTYQCYVVSQEQINANPDFYVEVPSYIYNDKKIDSETYKLYYQHTTSNVNKLYVVDNSDNAKENAIYKTLNYTVITSNELKQSITNYVAVAENDLNYNKNFQLYYKYDRAEVTGSNSVYVLKKDGISLQGTQYKFVESHQLSDYSVIDRTENPNLYREVSIAIHMAEDDIELYYKLENVYVQNELAGGNAVYVAYSSLDKTARLNYSRLMYTPIPESEIKNNSSLYVLIDSNDPNYDSGYKLYYKYEPKASRVVYSYDDINQTSSDFHKNGYELIKNGDENFEPGKELYYKKTMLNTNTKNITKPTFYFYQTSSTTTLSANSYYVISFYVNTIGQYAQASFGIKDTAKVIDNISINNIETNGKWEKYYIFLSTNDTTSSTINLYLYLGDEVNGIKGTHSSLETLDKCSVFFDDIKITKIGLSDFNKYSIDDVAIYSEANLYQPPSSEPEPQVEEDPIYIDKHDNIMHVANIDEQYKNANNYDARKYLDSSINVFGDNATWSTGDNATWSSMFNFDDPKAQEFLGKETDKEAEKLLNQLASVDPNSDGYDMYTSDFLTKWKYYISRDLGNDFSITNYINAYNSGKLEVTTTNIIEKSEEPEKDEDEDKSTEDDKKDDKNIEYITSPFNTNNFALRLKNSSKDTPLGITSNSFTVKQFEYYKISLWIYSPDLEGKATISVNSVLTDRQHPVYGSLLSSSISSVSANVENTSSKEYEYGWIPVTLYIEGNNFQDMECYLVLTADEDCTVYFDNIKIEKATSAQYDTASSKSSSNKYTCALSLTPKSSLISSDLTNGTFDYVKESSIDHDVTSAEPYAADNWTAFTTNSSRAVAGIVSTQQTAFFEKYALNDNADKNSYKIPTEYTGDISNIYAIHSPEDVLALDGVTKSGYRHTYSIYSASMSLSANAVYKISFKVYANANFDGTVIANLYNSAVKTANVISSISIDVDSTEDDESKQIIKPNTWQTITFYVATSTSSQTIYLEIGVEDAINTCFFKSAAAKKLTGKTLDSIIQSEATQLGIDNTSTETLYDAFKTIRFLNLANCDLGYHSTTINPDTNMFDSLAFTNKSDVTEKHTAGQIGVTVASFFDTINHTTYSVTINKVTYYVGEVYETTIDDVKYYIHKTYDAANNAFNYKLYSDAELKNEITQIGGTDAEILTTGVVKLKVGDTTYETTTTYRLFQFTDLREEVKTIGGSSVSVPSLENVIVGKGDHASENAITSTVNTSYVYHFNSQSDFELDNNIISANDLTNAQSGNVMILSNSHSTDFVTLTQTTTRTLGKSAYNILRIYVKTSDFANENVGLNINIDAVKVSWKNINTTKSTLADKYGFVCYEVLIQSNSTDSISNFAVSFSLGNSTIENDTNNSGYAIISKVSLESISSKEIFEHYSSLIDEDNENIKKAIYTDKASNASDKKEEADDKNSVSWATFFYIFSSILLVVTLAVAMIAIFLKKHPIKNAEKFENDHDRDIQTVNSTRKTSRKTRSKKDEIIIDLSENDKSSKNDGEII